MKSVDPQIQKKVSIVIIVSRLDVSGRVKHPSFSAEETPRGKECVYLAKSRPRKGKFIFNGGGNAKRQGLPDVTAIEIFPLPQAISPP